ncbi:MAG: tetratricopeptide repeat protein [Patescibacteria group bacterium]
MLYDVLPILVLFGAIVGFVITVGRRWSDIRLMKIEHLPEVITATKKRQLLLRGLQRRLRERTGHLWQRTAALRAETGERLGDFYERLLELDRRYRHANPSSAADVSTTDIASLLAVAKNAEQTGNKEEAERTYLDIITHDHRNTEAYRGLGRIYWNAGNREEAAQSFEYALRLDPRDAETYALLAAVSVELGALARGCSAYEQAVSFEPDHVPYRIGLGDTLVSMEDFPSAIATFEAAVALEPSNPRCLDRLIDVCILGGNKRLATSTLRHLATVNPDNNKLQEFEDRIKAMPRKRRTTEPSS